MSFDIQKFNWCFLSHLVSQEDGLAAVDDDAAHEVSIRTLDQSEASMHLHEHLAAGAGHGGPALAELLHQAGHDVPPAPGLRLRAFKGENSWLLCDKYFSVLLSLTILQHGVCPPVHHDLGLPEQGVEAEEDLQQLNRILALLVYHLLAGVFLDLVFARSD